MSGVPRTVRIARAVHRWLLVLVPRAVRHAYRSEMIATFETASAEASSRGWAAVWVLGPALQAARIAPIEALRGD